MCGGSNARVCYDQYCDVWRDHDTMCVDGVILECVRTKSRVFGGITILVCVCGGSNSNVC